MNTLKFTSRDVLIQVNADDIVYFKADGNSTRMFLASKEEQKLSMNLLKVQSLLKEQLGNEFLLFEKVGRDLVLRKAYIFSVHVLQQKVTFIAPNGNKFVEDVSKAAIKTLKASQETNTGNDSFQVRELATGKIYTLNIGLNRFGRKANPSLCEHPIDNGDSQLSRDHFRITISTNDETNTTECKLSDVYSSNGTLLNNHRIEKDIVLSLKIGDKIKAGKTEFVLEMMDVDKTEIV